MNTVRLVVCGFGISLLGAVLFVPASSAASVLSSARYENLKATRTESISSEISEKRAALEQKIADKKAEANNRLKGRRATTCQTREESINHLLQKRIDTAQEKLDKLTVVQDKLESIVDTHSLTVENAAALTTIMDDRRASTSAAIEAADVLVFECAATDATKPGKIIIDHMTSVREALKDYQTSLKDYVSAIKASAGQEKTERDS